ncbi:MAG: hypothetical protein ACTHN5_22920 [Phycisphaerae bacterium]
MANLATTPNLSPSRSAITLSLTPEETAIARWAIERWTHTFNQVIAEGHLPQHPPAPTLGNNTLHLPLHLDSLEELDYQLTIAPHDEEHNFPPSLSPATAQHLMHRIRRSLPPTIKLSS